MGKWIILALVVALLLFSFTNKKHQPEPHDPIKAILKLAEEVEKNPAPEIKEVVDTTWKYRTNTDEMTSQNIYLASVVSFNTVNFDFPYNGDQRARLTLRDHPRHGTDAILKIEKGQFICSLSECDVLVRFDNDQPITVKASEPESNDSTMLFLDAYDLFIANLTKAKTVKISATFYHEGSHVFEFDVSNFKKSAFIKNTSP